MSKKTFGAVALFSANTLLSRLLGFVRDMIFAWSFGATGGLDAFLVAFRIPNLMRSLFVEGLFAQAFVPVLSDWRRRRPQAETARFIADMSGSFMLIFAGLAMLALLCAPWIVRVFAPGFAPDEPRYGLAVDMLYITLPYLFLIAVTAFCAAVLNSGGSFGIPAFAPVFLNLSLIVAAVWLAPRLAVPIHALAWGVLIAGVIQPLFLLPFLRRQGMLVRPRINFRNPGVRQTLLLMGPAVFGVSVRQINLLIDTVFASFLATGSIAWLYYSERLLLFPMGLFGVSIATVMLPRLSRHAACEDDERYRLALDWAVRLLLLIGLPAAVGLFFLAGPILTTLFQYRQFTPHDIAMSRQSLMAFTVGLQGFMLAKVLAGAFYARKDIKTPVKIAVVAMLANLVFNAVLIVPLKHAGIALATSLSGWINAVLLWAALTRRGCAPLNATGRGRYLLRLLPANVVLALFLLLCRGASSQWLHGDLAMRLWRLSWLVVAGLSLYALSLWLAGLRPRHLRLTDGEAP